MCDEKEKQSLSTVFYISFVAMYLRLQSTDLCLCRKNGEEILIKT